MSGRILQINFKYNDVSAAMFEQTVNPMAEPISEVNGLRWKIMMHNEDTAEAGGVYLFENADSVDAYLASPIVAQITSHPALSDFSVKQFDIMEDFTAITRGPVGELAGA
jgi:hypothetical protein